MGNAGEVINPTVQKRDAKSAGKHTAEAINLTVQQLVKKHFAEDKYVDVNGFYTEQTGVVVTGKFKGAISNDDPNKIAFDNYVYELTVELNFLKTLFNLIRLDDNQRINIGISADNGEQVRYNRVSFIRNYLSDGKRPKSPTTEQSYYMFNGQI
ncbi:MAG: hypothetical protein PUP46_02955 [Endozoicomonas sp. (ex Botrylloides leachii)]|nr:hypothetical protein [Endozoicomonas sp. (ex Botrylloides leachii)]